jgi:hypothetical protein
MHDQYLVINRAQYADTNRGHRLKVLIALGPNISGERNGNCAIHQPLRAHLRNQNLEYFLKTALQAIKTWNMTFSAVTNTPPWSGYERNS